MSDHLFYLFADFTSSSTPSTTTPTTTTPTTNTPTTTSRAPQDRNMTVYVTSGDERALVEITSDVKASLSVGRHVIYRY